MGTMIKSWSTADIKNTEYEQTVHLMKWSWFILNVPRVIMKGSTATQRDMKIIKGSFKKESLPKKVKRESNRRTMIKHKTIAKIKLLTFVKTIGTVKQVKSTNAACSFGKSDCRENFLNLYTRITSLEPEKNYSFSIILGVSSSPISSNLEADLSTWDKFSQLFCLNNSTGLIERRISDTIGNKEIIILAYFDKDSGFKLYWASFVSRTCFSTTVVSSMLCSVYSKKSFIWINELEVAYPDVTIIDLTVRAYEPESS